MNYIRQCPVCSCEITHKRLRDMNSAKEKGSLCMSCCKKGSKNPFFGKSHKKETLEKIILTNKSNIDKYQSVEFREKMSKISSGKKNPMYGKTFYEIWLSKYGKEIADKKLLEFKKKQSENNSGENNNMYGKPSPNGSGNGWSGWYNDMFFKSLKELSCMIEFENNNIEFQSAECKKFRIKYIDYDNKSRNYYPDFFIPSENKIIECKPKHLFNSKNVECKRKYAEDFCKENGYTYEMIDPVRISDDLIKDLHESGRLKFTDRYELKFIEKFN